MKNFSIIFIFLLVLSVGMVVAVDKAQPPQNNQQNPKLIFSINETLNHLAHHIDLWHDANLKGDQEKIKLYEGVIDDIINENIAQTKAAVRNYAQLAVLEGVTSDDKELSLTEPDQTPNQSSEIFKGLVGNLNSQKKLSQAIQKTNVFSNKYRLLGDYIYLLKNELKIIKVELAQEEDNNKETEK